MADDKFYMREALAEARRAFDEGEIPIGAVVVCQGAADPGVQLRIVETVSAFTGLGSNRIVVQKMIS